MVGVVRVVHDCGGGLRMENCGNRGPDASIIFALVVAAVCGSLFCTPDYLHLNVNRTKRFRWQVKIRWRLIVVGLLIGLLPYECAGH